MARSDGAPFIEWTETDAEGKAHKYQTSTFPPAEGGLDIMWVLFALGAEPLGRMFEGFAATGALAEGFRQAIAAAAGKGEGSDGIADVLADTSIKIDFGAIGRDLRTAITSVDAGALHRRILSRTLRDGKRLADDAEFSRAYDRNYFESVKALRKVVEVNHFIPLPGTSGT